MIEAASAIGFMLVFLVASVLSSLVLCNAVLIGRGVLRALGSGVERRAAFFALVLPPVLGTTVALVLAARSLVGLADHCSQHLDHPHLCLRHGAAWAEQTWAIAGLLATLTYLTIRIAHRFFRLMRGTKALHRLVALADPIDAAPDVLIARARRTFSFAAGILTPRIVLSSEAWERLDATERLAVIEHERAHVDQRDLIARLILDLAALLGAPFLGARVLAIWDRATERLCDHRAAVRIGDPSAVASALVKMARATLRERDLGFATFSSPNVAERVEALLAGEWAGLRATTQLTRAVLLSLLLAISAVVLLADLIHHTLEHVIGAH